MIPRRIANATHFLGAPAEWDEKHGNCVHLWVRASSDGLCESAWEPTPEELKRLNEGAAIILRVVGRQPPVDILVE